MSRLLPHLLLVPLLVASCASTGGRDGNLTRGAELPEEERAILSAYLVDGPEWRIVREELKADPARARWMCENLSIELFRAYDNAELASFGQTQGPFERARAELIYFGEAAVPVLVDLMPAKDGVVPVVVSDILREIGEPAVQPVAALLDHEAWRPRRAAMELLGDLPHAGEEEAALEERIARIARDDAEWIVRAQAARTLGRRGAAHGTPEVARLGLSPVLSDDDPAVAREAARALGELGDPNGVPALLNYLERGERESDARAQDAALTSLRALTGARVQGGAREWRNWWVDHRGELLDPRPKKSY